MAIIELFFVKITNTLFGIVKVDTIKCPILNVSLDLGANITKGDLSEDDLRQLKSMLGECEILKTLMM